MNQLRIVYHALRSHPGFSLILLAFLALALAYGWTIPVFESPDASGHYAYIHELTEGRGLPVQGEPSGERVTGYVTSHPPLYYVLSAALSFWVPDDTDFWGVVWTNPHHANGYPGSVANKNLVIHHDERFPWRGTPLTVHIARLVSTILGAGAVLATYLIGLELFAGPDGGPGRGRWLALGAAALTAFNPMFVFTSARVSNDAAVACFGGLALWGAVRLAGRSLSRRGLALTGVAWGLAILSKFSGTTLGLALALALLVDGLRRPGYGPRETWANWQRPSFWLRHPLVRNGLVLFGAAALVCGWWFVRNLVLYDDFLGVDAWLSHTETVRSEPIGFFDVIPQLEGLEISYWAIFGWFNVAVADWIYDLLWWLVRLAFLGLLLVVADQFLLRFPLRWIPRRLRDWLGPRPLSRPVRWGLVVLFVGFLGAFGSVWRFIMIVLGSQGRYLVAVIAAISVFLMLGLSRLVSRRLHPFLAGGLGLGLFLLALLSLTEYILPAYAQPAAVTETDLPADMTRFDVHLGDSPVRLIGGRAHPESAHPGDRVTVDVYWQADALVEENYIAYVKLLGRGGAPVAGFDGYPGGGTWPTSLWQPGRIYRDRYYLPIDAGAEAPTLVSLNAGLRGEAGPLPPILDGGEPWPGGLVLDRLALRPERGLEVDLAYRLDVLLQSADGAERILLLGADAGSTRALPGGTLSLTLAWEADSEVEADYTVFAHLRDAEGQVVAQADGPPLGGDYPTSFWAAGDKVIETRLFHLPPDLVPGPYQVFVGLYRFETGIRLRRPDGADEIPLPVEVVAP